MNEHCMFDKCEMIQDHECFEIHWDKYEFTPGKRKCNSVEKIDSSYTSNKILKNGVCPSESNKELPLDVIYIIMLQLSVRDVLRCMRVCKSWNIWLNYKYFWKKYIQKHFDLNMKFDVTNEAVFLNQWSGPVWMDTEDDYFRDEEKSWECLFIDDVEEDDIYVMRPFPSMWNCGVVHPHGLDPLSGDVKSLQGFCRSLEILIYMENESSRLKLISGVQCSDSETVDITCAVLFPWNKKQLPTPLELLNGVFHFHPKIYENYERCAGYRGNVEVKELYYHGDDFDENHDLNDKPCLNRFFGSDEGLSFDEEDFYEWLRAIMCPSLTVHAGYLKINPVGLFLLTHLAPGWVGGGLTGVTYG